MAEKEAKYVVSRDGFLIECRGTKALNTVIKTFQCATCAFRPLDDDPRCEEESDPRSDLIRHSVQDWLPEFSLHGTETNRWSASKPPSSQPGNVGLKDDVRSPDDEPAQRSADKKKGKKSK